MSVSPILVLHIASGTLALPAGAAAIFFRKGSRRHRIAGKLFIIFMLGLGTSGAYLGFMKSQVSNVIAGTTTIYLVATAWLAGRKEKETSALDWAALFFILAVGFGSLAYGFAVAKSGVAVGPYLFPFFFSLLFATADLRMLSRGGFSGTQRLVRHLWRMCFALFIASGSLFLARPHLFPAILRRTYVIFLLGILPLILMIFWLIRVRMGSRRKAKAAPRLAGAHSVTT